MHRFLAPHAILVVIVSCAMSAPVHASERLAPRLVLAAAWYSVVEPYRYDEARRFERGWNRGADVVAAEGQVRAPITGRVRFAGSVAGRSVVTIETSVDALPVVVTLTGLERWDVAAGDLVRRGAIVGSGQRVHVGMYDQARRSRYLPVVGTSDVAGASTPTLSGAVAARLLDAIRGDVAPGRGGSERAGDVARAAIAPHKSSSEADVTSRPDSSGPWVPNSVRIALAAPDERDARLVAVRVAGGGRPAVPPQRSALLGAATLLPSEVAVTRAARPAAPAPRGEVDMRGEPASGPIGASVGPSVRSDAGSRSGSDSQRTDEPRDADTRTPDPAYAAAGTVSSDPGGGRSAPAGRTTPSGAPGVATLAVATPTEIDDPSPERESIEVASSSPARWSIPAAIASLVAMTLLAARRRRRAAIVPATCIARPLPPILPSMHHRPAAAVRTDGHSIIGGAPLAWADHDAGTSTHHEPELLRHDADLLPERAAAPGPRVHDDRGGRDHPVPATRGT